ncbi:hypothetical protein BC831DRAFT_27693 [Entophlyctis helioformis]|nr:hypothetical protein BC831DRAFT_27693 [Entophlyctis helioformis]
MCFGATSLSIPTFDVLSALTSCCCWSCVNEATVRSRDGTSSRLLIVSSSTDWHASCHACEVARATSAVISETAQSSH